MKTNSLKRVRYGVWVLGALAMLLLVVAIATPTAALPGDSKTYTLDADFDEGAMVNVNHDVADQLQLDSEQTPFDFIWIAASARGTVIKIDTNSGEILGEFRSTPSSQGGGNPSRTTVDGDGSVWVANRNNVSNGYGTVLHIGLEENGQCEDRSGNGQIETSTGLGDILAWTDNSGTRGVATAADECIVHYTQVNSTGTRHVSIDANNDVWVGGSSNHNFDLLKGGRYDMPGSGTILRSETSVGFGGYGGLMDSSGVIWSANPLLRWDPANPLSGLNGDPAGLSIGPPIDGRFWAGQTYDSYGLCIDSGGNVWNTQVRGDVIKKYAPDGTYLASYSHGNYYAQGCVVDDSDHVWVAHSLLGPQNTVGHLLNDGTLVGNVTVGSGPTGVAVDGSGKIWAGNINSNTATRIDPAAGSIGGGGVPVGQVDLTVDLGAGAGPYNYSDMTGSTLIAPPNSGTWTAVYDSGIVDPDWSKVSWTADEPGDSAVTVKVSASADNATYGSEVTMTNGGDPDIVGQYVKVVVTFDRAATGETPILYDLTILANQDPDCEDAEPSVAMIWPPNHRFWDIEVLGVTDPDGDPVTITIDSIWQDELVDERGDGTFAPDGDGVGTSTAQVRAERSGRGDGRFYHITFTADDGKGGTCGGPDHVIKVIVAHDRRRRPPVDGGPLFDSTIVP